MKTLLPTLFAVVAAVAGCETSSYRKPIVPMPHFSTLAAVPYERSAEQITISGQCFIKTQAGESVKLGLIEVAVYPREAFEQYDRQLRHEMADYMTASSEAMAYARQHGRHVDSISIGKAAAFFSSERWDALPEPVATSLTDADGIFTVSHHIAGEVVIFARGSRKLIDRTERYTWVVPINGPADKILLSNHNLRRELDGD